MADHDEESLQREDRDTRAGNDWALPEADCDCPWCEAARQQDHA